MASLLKRSNSPNYFISWNDRGVRRVLSAGTADKANAELLRAKYAEREWKWKKGITNSAEDQLEAASGAPLREHFDAFGQHLAAEERSDVHRADVAFVLSMFVEHAGGDSARLADLTAGAVRAWLEARRAAEGTGARTQNKYRSYLDACARWLVKQGRLASNPIASVPVLKIGKPLVRRRAMDASELERLFAAADARGEAVGTFFRMAYFQGLRRIELCRLPWSSVDFDGATLTITPDVGKCKTRTDAIPLHPEVIERLRAMKPANALPSARVFPAPISHRQRRAIFKAAGIASENAAGERADFHGLRVSLASHLAKAGASPIELQRTMRHSAFSMTDAHYVKTTAEDLRDAHSRIGAPKGPPQRNVVRQAAGAEFRQDGGGPHQEPARVRCSPPGEDARVGALADGEREGATGDERGKKVRWRVETPGPPRFNGGPDPPRSRSAPARTEGRPREEPCRAGAAGASRGSAPSSPSPRSAAAAPTSPP